jgi:hypothetical protein
MRARLPPAGGAEGQRTSPVRAPPRRGGASRPRRVSSCLPPDLDARRSSCGLAAPGPLVPVRHRFIQRRAIGGAGLAGVAINPEPAAPEIGQAPGCGLAAARTRHQTLDHGVSIRMWHPTAPPRTPAAGRRLPRRLTRPRGKRFWAVTDHIVALNTLFCNPSSPPITGPGPWRITASRLPGPPLHPGRHLRGSSGVPGHPLAVRLSLFPAARN